MYLVCQVSAVLAVGTLVRAAAAASSLNGVGLNATEDALAQRQTDALTGLLAASRAAQTAIVSK
jgi:hypothetical protein